MAKRKGSQDKLMVDIALHRKLKIEQHEPHKKPEVTSGVLC
jgi:hypothetical protein